MGRRKEIRKETWVFVGLLVLLATIFGWRQFYGFNKNDEIFYISTVYRFFQGDAMLIDEWNNVQLFAFITYPLYCLVRLFHHSNEGIVLIFRFCYLIFQAAVSIYCYLRMERFGWARIFPALFYFVTTPYNINSLSYNTLALGFLLLTLVTVASVDNPGWETGMLCGVFTAGVVLANPYAVLLFISYGCACAVYSFSCYRDRRRKKVFPELSIRFYLWMCMGAFLVFLLFLAFIFSRGSLGEILEGFTYIIMDKERKKPFWVKFAKYFIRIHRYYRVLVYVTAALIVLWFADRRERIPPAFYLAADALTAAAYVVYYGFFWEMVGINYMLVPLIFPGLIAFLVAKRRDGKLFFGWYLSAVVYTLLAHFATDTGIYTMSASCMVADAASMLLMWQVVREQKRIVWLKAIVCALLAVQFIAGIWLRVSYVWGDERLPLLTTGITQGPLKGIHTTRENALLYEEVLQDMGDLRLTSEDKLSVIGIAPWMYLNTEAECAAYSTWEILETDPLIFVYYRIHPEKLPTVVYCYGVDESILETDFAYNLVNQGYEPSTVRHGVALVRR